jgi:hypothetical protein
LPFLSPVVLKLSPVLMTVGQRSEFLTGVILSPVAGSEQLLTGVVVSPVLIRIRYKVLSRFPPFGLPPLTMILVHRLGSALERE